MKPNVHRVMATWLLLLASSTLWPLEARLAANLWWLVWWTAARCCLHAAVERRRGSFFCVAKRKNPKKRRPGAARNPGQKGMPQAPPNSPLA